MSLRQPGIPTCSCTNNDKHNKSLPEPECEFDTSEFDTRGSTVYFTCVLFVLFVLSTNKKVLN